MTAESQSTGKAARRPKPAGPTATKEKGRRETGRRPPGSVLAGSRPPPPGEGKRGESGYLGYLLRQAQAASRLTLERSLGEGGVTVPPFVGLTMLKAYPGLSRV